MENKEKKLREEAAEKNADHCEINEEANKEAKETAACGEASANDQETDCAGEEEGVLEEGAKTEGKESRFFKKKDKKEKKDKRDEKIEELNDRLMRTMAEFDNFRKRSEKEKSQMFEIGAKDVVEKILPVLDNFERGLNSVPEEDKNSAFVQGIEQIYKQFLTALENAGVTPIDAVGKEFDPNYHNAVMHDEDESLGENIVSEELLKGYMYRDSVVRHSMVKVVN